MNERPGIGPIPWGTWLFAGVSGILIWAVVVAAIWRLFW